MKLGKVRVSSQLILKWLDYYDGGKIRDVRFDGFYAGGVIDIVIEHPDMPEGKDGDRIGEISSAYISTTDDLGHAVTVRERK